VLVLELYRTADFLHSLKGEALRPLNPFLCNSAPSPSFLSANVYGMNHDYYLGAKYVILKLRERLVTRLDEKSFKILENELENIERELDLRLFVSEEQKKD
jgi:hypothetical protein